MFTDCLHVYIESLNSSDLKKFIAEKAAGVINETLNEVLVDSDIDLYNVIEGGLKFLSSSSEKRNEIIAAFQRECEISSDKHDSEAQELLEILNEYANKRDENGQ